MELIVMCSDLLKIFMITLVTYFIYVKITNYKNNDMHKTIFIICCSVNMSIIYIILKQYLQPVSVIIILEIIYATIINVIVMKEEFNYLTYVVSFIMAYIIFLVAVLISGIVLKLCIPDINFKNSISLITIPLIEIMLSNSILKIKRFDKGFNFLKNQTVNKEVINFSVLFCLVMILFFAILQNHNNKIVNKVLMATLLFIAIIFIIWIKTQITKTYKSKMRDRTIEIQKTEIDEQTKLIEEIKAENLKLATAVHKYNSKFESLEHAMKNALSLDSKTEFANEISVILKESEETLKNFAKEVEVNTNKLPLTNIAGIDKMFKYMQEEAAKDNINFDLKINESITPLIENIIPKEKFEILIGDHLKDAIIAIKASKATYKSILVTLGLVEGIYEFSIYDTGIEFEIDTLLKLGEEQVTTHKNEGGSGIGFMTTFETLKECKASLVIEEYNPETTNYTKSVTIKFDGKNEYKICSYRAEKIKEQKSKRRIIIEKMK